MMIETDSLDRFIRKIYFQHFRVPQYRETTLRIPKNPPPKNRKWTLLKISIFFWPHNQFLPTALWPSVPRHASWRMECPVQAGHMPGQVFCRALSIPHEREMDADSRDKISRRGKSVPPFWMHEKKTREEAIWPPSLIGRMKISENSPRARLQNI